MVRRRRQPQPSPVKASTTGDRLHEVIRRWTGADYTPTCHCRDLVGKMNSHVPDWTLANMKMIVNHLRQEASHFKWWAKIAVLLPGHRRPIVWMVQEAVRLAQEDANGSGQ